MRKGSAAVTATNGVATSRQASLRLAPPVARGREAAVAEGPGARSLGRLGKLISAHAPYDGAFALRVPGTYAIRRSRVSRELMRATVRPALCVVAQGAKVVMLGRDVFAYDASRMIAYSVDLPVAGQVVRASQAEPFLAFKLDLDPYKIADLTLKVYPNGAPNPRDHRGVFVGDATDEIVDAVSRLIELMADPGDAALLGPLVVDEILIRLLRSSIGPRVAQAGQAESGMQRVATAVAWMREHFAQPMTVESLADLAHMSVSSFHQHFKAITTMSPLQYQKALRLQEARRLMLSRTMDAGTAGRQVGYLSASQFSREYARMFGSAPTKDIARLRSEGQTLEDVAR